jgi:hypothetical protein
VLGRIDALVSTFNARINNLTAEISRLNAQVANLTTDVAKLKLGTRDFGHPSDHHATYMSIQQAGRVVAKTGGDGQWAIALSTESYASGRHYCEFKLLTRTQPGIGGGIMIGVQNVRNIFTEYAGDGGIPNGVSFHIANRIYRSGTYNSETVGTYQQGDIIGVELDMEAKQVRFKLYGAWTAFYPLGGTSYCWSAALDYLGDKWEVLPENCWHY